MKFEQRIFDFVRKFEAKRGRRPSGKLVAKCFPKAKSTTIATCLRTASTHRSLPVRKQAAPRRCRGWVPGMTIPLQGGIAAGFSARASEIPSPKGILSLGLADLDVMLRPGVFAMRVQGNSMVEAHIQDGDIVLLEPGRPRHRDIVAAAHEGCLLLKRLVIIGGVPYLKAENSAQPGLVRAIDKPIHGIFRGLLRFDRSPAKEATRHKPGVKYTPSQVRRLSSAVLTR